MKILQEPSIQKRKMLLGFLSWAVLAGALFSTLFVWRLTVKMIDQGKQAKFYNETSEIQFRVRERLNLYIDSLYGVQGLFAASHQVDEDEWRAFIRKQNIKGRYPGVEIFEWAEKIQQPGETKEAVLVRYVEPKEGNEKILEFDIASEPVRREALERARDTGEAAITGLIRFIQKEENQNGFLMVVPIYRHGFEGGNVAARREAFLGVVGGQIKNKDLFAHLFPLGSAPLIDFEIFEGDEENVENVIYDSSPSALLEFRHSKLLRTLNIEVGGRSWIIQFSAMPGFGENWVEVRVSFFVLGTGIVLSFLLFGILYSLGASHSRALELAHVMTQELRAEMEERKMIEAKREELYLAVESANRELTDFAYVVSHDLKAPLRGIHSLAAWIVEDKKEELTEDSRNKLVLLNERVERMTRLIDGILEYSRLGKVREEVVDVDLNEVVLDVADIVAPPAHIKIEIENNLPVLRVEKTRIYQLLQNLISNAVKAMDKPSGMIQVGCEEERGFWKIHVRDNGPGIEPQYLENIFKIFQTVPNYYNPEGTGIGLAIAKKIVEIYGGRIWAESKPGKGAAFFFTFPRHLK